MGASAQSSSRFDLICEGTITARSVDLSGTLSEPTTADWSKRFSIDLSRRLFCAEGCRAARRIVSITPSEITLIEDDDGPEMFGLFLNRVDGSLRQMMAVRDAAGLTTGEVSASCSPAPFTAFPTTRF